jgi:hypothetical protein
MPVVREISPVWVSEGGLEPRSWWYIPESGIHHQPKLTRQGPPGSAFRSRIAAAPPGPHDQSEHLTCGNDDRGQPESSCRPGPDGGIRTAALHYLAGMVTASRCCPEVPAPQPQPPRTSPDDLAAELNPHKTELNPHKAVEAASRARTDQTGLPSSGQSPPARQLAKAELSRRPRSAVPMTLRCRHGPSLRTRSRYGWNQWLAHGRRSPHRAGNMRAVLASGADLIGSACLAPSRG